MRSGGQPNWLAARAPITRWTVEYARAGRPAVPTMSIFRQGPIQQRVPVPHDQGLLADVTARGAAGAIVNVARVCVTQAVA